MGGARLRHPSILSSVCCLRGGGPRCDKGLVSWKMPHQVSPKGLGEDHLLLQFLLDVLS